MSPRADPTQSGFAAGLRPDAATPAGVVTPRGHPATRRFAVHRNNVSAARAEALAASFPAVARLLGADYFRALALEFAAAQPPRSPVLHEWGGAFGDFIAGFPPLAAYPYLADVARLERAWLEAYHAADAAPLDASALAAVAEALADVRLRPHPAARLLRSPHPVLSIFRANREAADGGAISAGPEDVLVTRPQLTVEARVLPPGGAAFLQALSTGESLGDAARAGAGHAGFDLAGNIAGLLEAGAFAALAD